VFCPRCGDEYREGFSWCHDCEVALVENLPDEPIEEAIENGETAIEADARHAAEADPKEESLRILELGLVLAIGFGYSLVASLHHWWHGVTHGSGSPGTDPMWSALWDIARSAPAICVLLYVLSRRGRGLRQLGVTASWSDLPLGLALAVLSFFPLQLLIVLRSKLPLSEFFTRMDWSALRLSTDALAPIVMAGILCVAANEELIVRAYMMSEVLDLTGSAFLAVASSTCLQALYHLYQGRWWALSHAMTFLVYSLFYWKTRRATPVVLAHFAHNFWLALSGPAF